MNKCLLQVGIPRLRQRRATGLHGVSFSGLIVFPSVCGALEGDHVCSVAAFPHPQGCRAPGNLRAFVLWGPPGSLHAFALSSSPGEAQKWDLAGPKEVAWTSQGGEWLKNPPANGGNMSSIPGSGRSPGVGNTQPLQCSCLKNPMDRGAWWATVNGVAKESDMI